MKLRTTIVFNFVGISSKDISPESLMGVFSNVQQDLDFNFSLGTKDFEVQWPSIKIEKVEEIKRSKKT